LPPWASIKCCRQVKRDSGILRSARELEIEAENQPRTILVGAVSVPNPAKPERLVEAVGDVLVWPAPEDHGAGASGAGGGEAAPAEPAADAAAAAERGDREARELGLPDQRDLAARFRQVEHHSTDQGAGLLRDEHVPVAGRFLDVREHVGGRPFARSAAAVGLRPELRNLLPITRASLPDRRIHPATVGKRARLVYPRAGPSYECIHREKMDLR
jgi:hypothetical protein